MKNKRKQNNNNNNNNNNNSVKDLPKAFLGNGSVNTFQHTRGQQYSRSVLYVVRATQQ
jgi:hypothetical protein